MTMDDVIRERRREERLREKAARARSSRRRARLLRRAEKARVAALGELRRSWSDPPPRTLPVRSRDR